VATADSSVLVLGATGTVGQHVVRELRARGAPVRALVRSERKLPEGVQRARGDLLDRASVNSALEGVKAAIFIAPHDEREEEMTENVLAACAEKNVRLTYFSAGLPGESLWVRRFWRYAMAPLFPHYWQRFKLAERVFAHPSRPLIVGSVAFCQVTDPFVDDILDGRYTEPAGKLGMGRVDAYDIGAILAIVTLNPPPAQRVLAVEGRDAITGPKAAALWAAALGRPVAYESHKTGRWKQVLHAHFSGIKLDHYIKTLRTMPFAMVPVSGGRLKKTEALLGRPARGYSDYVNDRVGELRAEGRLEAASSARELAPASRVA
jgi:uncharacterized protein YbjT (DUF2867 family)